MWRPLIKALWLGATRLARPFETSLPKLCMRLIGR
uniref:Uncharacterized protein n=1 Tax=Arundo donax TaxID=35708 RepID=A0A0A8Y506_ARUDO